jgi:hypothetical protein
VTETSPGTCGWQNDQHQAYTWVPISVSMRNLPILVAANLLHLTVEEVMYVIAE